MMLKLKDGSTYSFIDPDYSLSGLLTGNKIQSFTGSGIIFDVSN